MIDDSACVWRISGLMRDGTAEPVSRDQIIRRERGKGFFFTVQLTTSKIGNNAWAHSLTGSSSFRDSDLKR